MNSALRLLLGVIAVLPLALSVLGVGAILYLFLNDPLSLERFFLSLESFSLSLDSIAGSLIGIALLLGAYAPVLFYIFHAARNSDLADRRPMWIVLFVFIGGFAMPVYWYLFIWQEGYYES